MPHLIVFHSQDEDEDKIIAAYRRKDLPAGWTAEYHEVESPAMIDYLVQSAANYRKWFDTLRLIIDIASSLFHLQPNKSDANILIIRSTVFGNNDSELRLYLSRTSLFRSYNRPPSLVVAGTTTDKESWTNSQCEAAFDHGLDILIDDGRAALNAHAVHHELALMAALQRRLRDGFVSRTALGVLHFGLAFLLIPLIGEYAKLIAQGLEALAFSFPIWLICAVIATIICGFVRSGLTKQFPKNKYLHPKNKYLRHWSVLLVIPGGSIAGAVFFVCLLRALGMVRPHWYWLIEQLTGLTPVCN